MYIYPHTRVSSFPELISVARVNVCDHEITHTICAICQDKILAFLHQQKCTKLY